MINVLFILGKSLIASALLFGFYWIVLRHRASYKLNRHFLLALPLLSLLTAVTTIQLPIESRMPWNEAEAIEALQSRFIATPSHKNQTSAERQTPMMATGTSAHSAQAATTTPAAKLEPTAESAPNSINYLTWAMWTVAIISLLLLSAGIYYILRLLSIRSKMQAETTAEGYDIFRSHSVNTPFSFAHSIFLPNDIQPERESLIVQHEKAHIAHGHYVEVWLMEGITRLFWFNPLFWLCRSELRNIHEYEADHDVICQGTDIHVYQSTLLEMVLNESCPVVNGFNHSFIRQRFVEMKSSTAGTLGRLGKATLALWCLLLFGFFSLRCTQQKDGNDHNFTLHIIASPTIEDCAYRIRLGETPEYVDIPLDQQRRCTYTCHLDKEVTGVVTALFPDSSVCVLNEVFPFVPGQEVTLSVEHAHWTLSGSGLYQEWANAQTANESISHKADRLKWRQEEIDQARLEYLKEHKNEPGCCAYYIRKLPVHKPQQLLECLPQEVAESEQCQLLRDLVKALKASEVIKRQDSAYLAQNPNTPLYVIRYAHDTTSLTVRSTTLAIEDLKKDFYVIFKKYEGTDPKRPYAYRPQSANGVIVYGPRPEEVSKAQE